MTTTADSAPTEARLRAFAGRALDWWLSELHGATEDVLGRLGFGDRNAVVIEAGETTWTVTYRETVLGRIELAAGNTRFREELRRIISSAPKASGIIVDIPQDRALSKVVRLPTAARTELDRMLRFEFSRHFPFAPERVYFSHRMAPNRNPLNRGLIEVELVVVPRDVVSDVCRELAAAELAPRRVAVAGAGGKHRLFLPRSIVGSAPAYGWGARALVGALAFAALAAIVSPVIQQQVHLAALDRELAQLTPQAKVALDDQMQQRQRAARSAAVWQLKATRQPMVMVLDELTRMIADGAWLLSVRITGKELVIDGLAPSAASTALGLEQSAFFSKVTFRAPIVRDAGTGLEHFQISAAMAGAQP
jgi:general secretion pathway protein L